MQPSGTCLSLYSPSRLITLVHEMHNNYVTPVLDRFLSVCLRNDCISET